MLWLWTLLWCPLEGSSAEGKPPKEVIGNLGGSATFQLEGPNSLDKVFWFKGDVQVGFLKAGPPCEVYRIDAFASRDVVASEDCRSLTLGGLIQEDSAGYKALVPDSTRETFNLKVYKRLSEADLTIDCAEDGDANLKLNCSAGKWEDSVNYSWIVSTEKGVFLSHQKPLLLHKPDEGNDGNVTCTAQNPVGRAIKTFSLQQACAGVTEEPRGLSPGAAIGVTIAAGIVAKIAIAVCFLAKWLPCPK